jgi:uncharacterized membrane protein
MIEWHSLFGARAQTAVGVVVSFVSVCFWALGCLRVPGAWVAPWRWSQGAYIFHASMFALLVAAYAIVATGLAYQATERVEEQTG